MPGDIAFSLLTHDVSEPTQRPEAKGNHINAFWSTLKINDIFSLHYC